MISVIIPTYNDGAYLDACLDSIRSQQLNGQTIEVIVVDDGSEEKELRSEGVKELRSEGVTFIRQEHAGQSAARNRGLQAAKGEFIVFVDADDRLEPDWMARHLEAIDGVEYVQSGYVRSEGVKELRSEGVKELRSEGVIFIRQEHAGQSAARNRGLQAAKGEFIVFVDADDRLEPDWMARHLSAIEGVDYVQSGYKRVKCQMTIPSDRALQEQRNVKCQMSNIKSPINQYQFTSPCMRLYRREAIEGMRFEEGMIYEDVLWSVDLWQRNLKCRMIPYAGYLYTLNPKSTTSRPHPDAQQKLFQALRERAHNAPLRHKLRIYYTILRLKIHFIKLKIEN